MVTFIVGEKYLRKDIYRSLGLPEDTKGSNWETGYNRHNDDWFLFCFVGHEVANQYQNKFVDRNLHWYGKSGSKLKHETIQSMLNPAGKVHIFYREKKRTPFEYAGEGKAIGWEDSTPVKLIWSFSDNDEDSLDSYQDEVIESKKYIEGALKQIRVNAYERDPDARKKCLDHYGFKCSVCNFDFEEVYGILGSKFIHVHHLKPLGEIKKEYELDPITDMRPVCPNCHAMIHRKRSVLSVDELKKLITK